MIPSFLSSAICEHNFFFFEKKKQREKEKNMRNSKNICNRSLGVLKTLNKTIIIHNLKIILYNVLCVCVCVCLM